MTRPDVRARQLKAARFTRGGGAMKAAGEEFETALEHVHAAYASAGRANIRRHFPAIVSAGQAAPGFWRIKAGAKTPPDFNGHVRGIGGVLFDAKSMSDGASYRHQPDRLHQIESLRDHQRCGGRGFLLVLDRSLRWLYCVEAPDVLAQLAAGRSVPLRTDARGKNVPRPLHACLAFSELQLFTGQLDWLPILQQLPTTGPSNP